MRVAWRPPAAPGGGAVARPRPHRCASARSLAAGLWGARRRRPPAILAQDLPRGQIVDEVKCAADPSQSYALYLPSNYSPDRAWSLLVGFHPAARGRAIAETYQAAAEKYGYVVAGSNSSRNG